MSANPPAALLSSPASALSAQSASVKSVELTLQVKDGAIRPPLLSPGHYDPMTLTWNNVRFSVDVPDETNSKVKKKKEILHGISGEVRPGEMVAILGQSGAGKTTLLNVLSARAVQGHLKGQILLNGAKRDKTFRKRCAFVEQQDVLFPNLTVEETLHFASELRLPSDVTTAEKKAAVESIIADLGLSKCRETFIGSVMRAGISGGEKRRVSLGVSMIAQPSLIALDEPTSGLDSTTAFKVISTLKSLSLKNKGILCTIHQPQSKIFNLFDKIVLLAEGRLCFFGTPEEALVFFEANGHPCPERTNPADFYLDVLQDHSVSDALADAFALVHPVTAVDDIKETDAQRKVDDNGMQLEAIVDQGQQQQQQQPRFNNTWLHELKILTYRNAINFSRDPYATRVVAMQTLFISLLLGVLFWQLDTSQSSVQTRSGAIFFLLINQSFSPMFAALRLFTEERPIVRSERSAGAYRVSTYFLAKNISEFPVQVMFPLVLSSIVYPMLGFQSGADHFFTFLALILVHVTVSQSFGLAISTLTPSFQVAQAVAPLTMVVSMLFGGFFLNSGDVASFLVVFKYLSFINWTFRGLMQNEWEGITLDTSTCKQNQVDGGQCFATGKQVLDQLGFGDPSVGWIILILLTFTVVLRTLAYIALRVKDKPKILLDTALMDDEDDNTKKNE